MYSVTMFEAHLGYLFLSHLATQLSRPNRFLINLLGTPPGEYFLVIGLGTPLGGVLPSNRPLSTFHGWVHYNGLAFNGKNNGFPFLDILGYLKNTHKNPNLAKWDKSQPGNSQLSSQIGTCLTLPNLGFYGYSLNTLRYPKVGIRYFFLRFSLELLEWDSTCSGFARSENSDG